MNSKSYRVFNYQKDTVHAALEIMGAIGVKTPADLKPWHINKRVSHEKTSSYFSTS